MEFRGFQDNGLRRTLDNVWLNSPGIRSIFLVVNNSTRANRTYLLRAFHGLFCSLLVGVMITNAASVHARPLNDVQPEAKHAFPTQVFFGDTHVHTSLSGDAFALGTRLMPEDAYRFAKGHEIRATGGSSVRLHRPLDFLLIADHAENLGVLRHLGHDSSQLPDTLDRERWSAYFADLLPLVDVLNAPSVEVFNQGNAALGTAKGAWQGNYAIDNHFRQSIWADVIATAERHNEPGVFTTFVGFEWSGRAPNMIHRNVLFADGPDITSKVLPFSRFDSDNVEDLWNYLSNYRDTHGGDGIAIPHNANLSGGLMFSPRDQNGEPLSREYAQTRLQWEPVLEVTQIKGDSETHPAISPNDGFADFETWDGAAAKGNDNNQDADALDWARQSYARSALQLGLKHSLELGVNPFKFGMIGSTDTHTALATADEHAFWGKMGLNEPSRFRVASQWIFSASGYAAIWAAENTRESLFRALKRKETYATTGPRMLVRFFGGWTFTSVDANHNNIATVGYKKGVPMGGDLSSSNESIAPTFLASATKDVDGANLDRMQIVKGWVRPDGTIAEKVYDVAVAPQSNDVASTVDVDNASYTNNIGATVLTAVWHDPNFDRSVPASYYLRVIEIPTPRWTAYDVRFFGIENLPKNVPMIVQDRAYTSPIWYTPEPLGAN